ncbi:MAG: Gfo/Idh/MocA family oxidoreductase [Mycobacteriales bacterium]|nr:Gfo/Idh/MocA family oxidoreductase [Mycobacteriales bacterium]
MTVRVAVVGCGTVARTGHLPSLRLGGDADVVAFASRSARSAELARNAWGSGDATTDWRAAVARPDVDAVHVCVPNVLHHEVALAALRAGKHVLVEKPLTTTLRDADELVALADREGLLLGQCFEGRISPGLQELRRRVPAIGEVERVEVSLGHAGPQSWSADSGWFRDPALSGGGVLIDLGVHVLDALRWTLADLEEVVSAELTGPVEEVASLELRLVGGTPASVVVSWQAPEQQFSFRFTGARGTLEVDGGRLLQDGAEVEVGQPELRGTAGAFARSVATGSPLVADGRDGRAALAAVLAGYESARTGAPVTVA